MVLKVWMVKDQLTYASVNLLLPLPIVVPTWGMVISLGFNLILSDRYLPGELPLQHDLAVAHF